MLIARTGNHTLQALFAAPDCYWIGSIDSYDGPVSDPGNLTGYENDGAFAVLQGNATQQQFGEVVGVLNAEATGRIYAYGYRCEGWDGKLGVYVSADGENWNYVSSQNINNTSPDWIDCGASASPFTYVLLTTEDAEMTSLVQLDSVRVNLPVYNFTLTVSSGSGGSTDPSPSTYEDILEGTPVEVTANQDTGFLFDYWLLDEDPYYQNPISVTMSDDHTLEAVFAEDPYYYWLTVEAIDLNCENEVYPDVEVDEEYVGAAPLSVRVLEGATLVELDEYVWCDHCERDCLLYFISYGDYYGEYYAEAVEYVVEVPVESDTGVWAVYLAYY